MENYYEHLIHLLKKLQLNNFDEISVEQDLKIRRIMELIQLTIKRFKLALIVPKLFENPRILGKYLLGTKYEECFYTIKQYCEEKRDMPQPNKLDVSMNRLIDYLMESPDLLDYLPNWINDLSKLDKILIKCMEYIHETAKVNFTKTARLLMDNERIIHKLYLANEETKINIISCEHQLQLKKKRYLWKSVAKSGIIKMLEEELAFLKYDFNMRVKDEMIIADTNIKQIQMQTANKQRELEEEVSNIRTAYANDVLKNFEKEKEAKNERNKTLLQLQALIQKYDQTLLDKEKEELSLNETLSELQKEMADFMVDFRYEEHIYEELFVRKDEEMRRQHESDVLDFTMNRAAKIIQHAYRKHLAERKQIEKENRAAKSKKGKGTTKAEAKDKTPKKPAKK